MKFLADESVDFPVIRLLRESGFDVTSVSEEFPSKQDDFILDAANREDRLLITSDKDFGELVYRLKRVSKGVVLLRLEQLRSSEKAALVLKVLRDRDDELLNAFVVIRKDMVRLRRM